MRYVELNLDGLVGPLFSFGGLAFGNTACQANSMEISNPREAALQGLAKMRFLAQKGIPQAVLPPHERPAIQALRRLGFNGSDETVLQRAAHDCFPIFLRHCSASSMWAANAATVAPSVDTMDGLVHITPANLAAHFHRSLEAAFTSCILKEVFSDPRFFCHHSPLPTHPDFGDEGAANHSRFALAARARWARRPSGSARRNRSDAARNRNRCGSPRRAERNPPSPRPIPCLWSPPRGSPHTSDADRPAAQATRARARDRKYGQNIDMCAGGCSR
ncbi:MAG: N-succinylarginine dihydrolase [Anaerolineales bacterium]